MTDLEKLKAKWNKKLLDSGFEDIENSDGSLKNSTDPRTIASALKEKDARQTYYSTAQEFLNVGTFSSLEEYAIWKAHCDGVSFRKIAKELGTTFYRVRSITVKFQKLAKLRK